MKIAVVSSFDNYGHMGVYVADAWETNGHEVDRVDRKDIVLNPSGYDVVLFVDCSEDYSDRIPKCPDCIKIFWSLDAHMPGGTERSVNIARKCDLVFSTNYEYGVKVLEKFGIDSFLLPVTYHDRYLSGGVKSKGLNAVMIGNPNSAARRELWELLNERYGTNPFGGVFTGIAETEKEYVNAMMNAKRVINQPTEPWDNILNNRFFEGLAVRAHVFQKRLKTDLIERLGFIDGKHFTYWDDFDDLREKLGTSLGRSNLSDAQRLVRRYSMVNQVAKMEAIILSKFYEKL